MKIKAFFYLYLFLFPNSYCYSQFDSTGFTLEIAAKDLSEDVSVMSSKNDELLILIYELSGEDSILNAPVFVSQFILDTSDRVEKIDKLSFTKNRYQIFLIELDDDRTVEQIDPVIRIYNNEILRLFKDKKYNLLQTYFGNNDLLGYAELNFHEKDKPIEIECKGRLNLDSYYYTMKFYKNF